MGEHTLVLLHNDFNINIQILKTMKYYFWLIILFIPGMLQAKISLVEHPSQMKSVFTLFDSKTSTTIYYDENDYPVVKKAAGLFASDIEKVTGVKPPIQTVFQNIKSILIVGSIEKNRLIKLLAQEGKIDISSLTGTWERYLIQTVENPFPGINQALIVAGSDRRGTAYGLFTLSEIIGVSPWYWWADVPVKKHQHLYINVATTLSKSPSVKYRGIFLNDEDWGLTPWASKNFEKEHGNIGPKTYARVCELLLRLKANHLAPAMHPVSIAFNQIPENKLVADTFAIVMGSTHCEPLLLNTASEWNEKTMGHWDYTTNKDKINEVLSKRIKENKSYENVYTLALRGLHDAAIGVGTPMKDKVKMLEEALLDQRNILSKEIKKTIESIPQAFTPYKEVLDIYSNGLELPEDVTIIWPDDNYGYLKRLSGINEQKRSGRSGVYYHVSYLGVPHSYLWFSTTPPALMYEELRKAYDTTADQVWLLNCGDLKGSEMQVSLFLDMAYNIDQHNEDNVVTYPARWLANMFGDDYYSVFEDITRTHIKLAFSRKPEYMGWGYHWNVFDKPCEQLTDTEFSFINYNEAESRITEYKRIGNKVNGLLNSIDEKGYAALYQLLYYPVKGAELMNRMTLNGQRSRWYAHQQRASTDLIKHEVEICFDSLKIITDDYNNLLNGKWRYMMSLRQNYDNTSAYFNLPHMDEHIPASPFPKLALQIANEDVTNTLRSYHALPCFNTYLRKIYWIDVYNKGVGTLSWKAKPSDNWIMLDRTAGKTDTEERIHISINWDKVPLGEKIAGDILITDGKEQYKVLVSVFNPPYPDRKEIAGMYVEDNGCISIPAAGFHRKKENNDIKMKIVDGLGVEEQALQLGNPIAPLQIYRSPQVPNVEYDFYSFNAGIVDVYTYVLPTFPLHADRDFRLPEHTNVDTKYSVRIDDGSIATPTTSAIEYTQVWFEGVLRNCTINRSKLYIDKPGKHTLQIRCGDPGVVIQKIVIDLGGMQRSYLGPNSTLSVLQN